MKNQKPNDQLSQLARILRQPRYAALAFGAASLVVVGAGVALRNFSGGGIPLNMGGFSEGPTTALERPAETQLSSGLDSTDMATFGEKPAQGARGSGGNTPVAPDSQDKAEKTETPLSEFPTGADPRKLNLKGQDQGGGGGSGAAAAAPSLGGPFERMSSLAGRAFNNSQAFFRSLGGKTRQAGAPKNQGGAAPQTQFSADKTAVNNTDPKTNVRPTDRGSAVNNSAGSPIPVGGTPIGGTGAGLGEGPKESKGSGGQGGGGSGGGGGGTTTSTTTASGTVVTSSGTGTMVLALEALNNAFDSLNKECGAWKTPVSETCLKLQAETIAADKEVDGLFGQASSNMKLLIGEIEKSCGSGFWMGKAKNPVESAKNCNSAIEVALEAAKKEELEKSLEKNSEVVDVDARDLRQALEDLNKAFDALSKECGKDKWDKTPSEKCEKLRAEAEAAGKRVDELFSGASASGQDLIKKMWASCGTGFWMGGAKNPAESAKNCNNAIEAALAEAKKVEETAKEEDKASDENDGNADTDTNTSTDAGTDKDKESGDNDDAALLALADLSKAFDNLNKACGKDKWEATPSKDCKKLQDAVIAARARVDKLYSGASADVKTRIDAMSERCGSGFWMGGAKNPMESAKNCQAAIDGKATDTASGGNKDDTALRALKDLTEAFNNLIKGCGNWETAPSKDCKKLQDAVIAARARVDKLSEKASPDVLAKIEAMRNQCGEGYWMKDAADAERCKATIGGAVAAAGEQSKITERDAVKLVHAAEDVLNTLKAEKESACKIASASEACAKAKKRVEDQIKAVEDAKKMRPSGCVDWKKTPQECLGATLNDPGLILDSLQNGAKLSLTDGIKDGSAKQEEKESGIQDDTALLALKDLTKTFDKLIKGCGNWETTPSKDCKKIQDAVIAARARVDKLSEKASPDVLAKIEAMRTQCGKGYWMKDKADAERCRATIGGAAAAAELQEKAAEKDVVKVVYAAQDVLRGLEADRDNKCEIAPASEACAKAKKRVEDQIKAVDIAQKMRPSGCTEWWKTPQQCWEATKKDGSLFWDDVYKNIFGIKDEGAKEVAKQDEKESGNGNKNDIALQALEDLKRTFASLNKKCASKWDKPLSSDDKECKKLQAETLVARKKVDKIFDQVSADVQAQIAAMRNHCGAGYWMGKAENAQKCANAIDGALAAGQKDIKKSTEKEQVAKDQPQEKKETTAKDQAADKNKVTTATDPLAPSEIEKKNWTSRQSYDLAKKLSDDLKDTKKWASGRMSPASKGYSKEMSLKYEEQARLAQALKTRASENPADVLKSLGLKSDFSSLNLGDIKKVDYSSAKLGQQYVKTDQNQQKITTQPKPVVLDTKKTGSNQKDKFNVVTPEGKSQGMMVIECDPSKGMLRSGVNGNVCQLVGTAKDLPVATWVGTNKSPSGWNFGQHCGKNETRKVTNIPLPGRGQCEPNKVVTNTLTNKNTAQIKTTQNGNTTISKTADTCPQGFTSDPSQTKGKKCSIAQCGSRGGWVCR